MYSFSSSFLSKLSQVPQNRHHPTTHFNVSSLHKENKKQTTTTAATSAPSPPHHNKATTLPPSTTHTVPPSLPATICNAFDDLINSFIDPPGLKPCFDPKHHLSGNFAPVDELPPTECRIISGALPPSLDGAYIRNGPNPQFLPRGPHHFFDGDGMLHAITISGGKATLCSRFVKTYKYKIERQIGRPIIPKWFSGFNSLNASAARGAAAAIRVLSGQYNPNNGIGPANTSLALISGRLYALGESDLPYSVKLDPNGEIHTLGRRDFNGKLAMSMTAHPKTDAQTGETFAFRYGPVRPFLTFFRFNSDGEKQPDVAIRSVTSPTLLHDFAITQKYAIFNDIQIEMMTGDSIVGVNSGKVARIGVIPRYAEDETEMRWFEAAGFNPLHAINAWDEEDGNGIVMVAANMLSVEHTLERMDLVHALLEMVRIDLRNGVVTRHPLSARNLDLGVINPALIGRKNRYVYAAIGDSPPKNSGVAKLDLSITEDDRRDCIVATRMFGPGCFGGEPFFVGRQPDNPNADEDDGYVLTYTHNENTGESSFLVMEANSPNLHIVADVRLPRRVPYGIHGIFVPQTHLNNLL